MLRSLVGSEMCIRDSLKGAGGLKPILLSDSFEALRAAGVAGVVPVVLPARVASRNSDLVEITPPQLVAAGKHRLLIVSQASCCLLYTSDAADDLLCVDLGGRRIIKKKTKKKQQHTQQTTQ